MVAQWPLAKLGQVFEAGLHELPRPPAAKEFCEVVEALVSHAGTQSAALNPLKPRVYRGVAHTQANAWLKQALECSALMHYKELDSLLQVVLLFTT